MYPPAAKRFPALRRPLALGTGAKLKLVWLFAVLTLNLTACVAPVAAPQAQPEEEPPAPLPVPPIMTLEAQTEATIDAVRTDQSVSLATLEAETQATIDAVVGATVVAARTAGITVTLEAEALATIDAVRTALEAETQATIDAALATEATARVSIEETLTTEEATKQAARTETARAAQTTQAAATAPTQTPTMPSPAAPTLKPTGTRAPSPTLLLTPTPAPACKVVAQSLNLRSGPGTVYPPISTLANGGRLEPLARSSARDWIQVRVPESGLVGWVAASPASVDCNFSIASLPVGEVPPTPIPSPAPTDTLLPPSRTLSPTYTLRPTNTATPFLPTPTLTPDIDKIVEEKLENLDPGRFAFHIPDVMKVGVTERVVARIAKEPTLALATPTRTPELGQQETPTPSPTSVKTATPDPILGGFKPSVTPTVVPINVNTFMKVRLIGQAEDFEIKALSSEEQVVGGKEPTQWAWDVKPRKAGERQLQLMVTVRIKVPKYGVEEVRDYPVFEKKIRVNVNWPDTARRMVEKYQQWIVWIVIILLVIGGSIVARRWNILETDRRADTSTPEKDPLGQTDLTHLRELLVESFDDEELRTLCFDLDIDYDSLPGRGKTAKARELIASLERRGRIPELIEIVSKRRPHISWPEIS